MRSYLMFLITWLSAYTVIAAEPSHCTINEKTFFNCQLEKSEKVVSVCSSNDVSEKDGYIQYRFGVPGKIELEFPKTKRFSKSNFLYSEIRNFNRDGTSYRHILKFKISSYNYAIEESSGSWWEKDENSNDPEAGHDRSENSSYVEVSSKDKTVTLTCKKPYTSSINNLKEFIECDKDNSEFTGCINAEKLQQ